MITTLLSAGVGLFTDWLGNKRKKAEAQAKAEAKQIENAGAWELAAMKRPGKLLRFVSYSMFGLPMIISVIWPEQGGKIWANLDTVPDWYLTAFISINGAVWGIAELKQPIAAIAGRVRRNA